MNPPDISVLIVSFNTRDLLRRCLASLRDQAGGTGIETIVVDNASRDGSADMVEAEFPDVRLIRSPVNLGFGNANNLAFTQSRGRYLVLLNSDACLAPGLLDAASKRMDACPDVGMAGGRLVGPEGGWQPSARMFPSLLNEFLVLSGLAHRYPKSRLFGRFDRTWADPSEEAGVDWVPGAFAILRRDLIDRIGFFDPRFFLYYEEVDLCRRIRAAGCKIMYWPELVITHLGGESAKTLSDMEFSSHASQLTLWRMRSQALYYRKWHGLALAWSAKTLEQLWHWLRALRHRRSAPAKAHDSEALIRLWNRAWKETEGGRVSPPQPW
ncbi:glycosyl transferase, group 2 family [Methylococcus capsulatus str. Bath]|jgi:hypothetical protein|uniref:Glycosyl transferase, group 2 family n=1 Tax=Methylococcus capsulatus (strain ATCC 33009 / NCIMB 11132 / Bath) TaxID=243233 RepID=Q608Q5_METCA|nr:glycosyltransferase family 2 protein [Methylococcus capsulatus]AAU92264.1 glycosyl transferase, group 2 family [Methylococcus capsulatus str. Bath]